MAERHQAYHRAEVSRVHLSAGVRGYVQRVELSAPSDRMAAAMTPTARSFGFWHGFIAGGIAMGWALIILSAVVLGVP